MTQLPTRKERTRLEGPLLITGARGYVGARLASHLQSLGARVLTFSRKAGDEHLSYDDLDEHLHDAAALIHCAAITQWFGDREAIMATNGTWPLELYARAQRCGTGAFLFLSSIAAYGYWNRTPACIAEATEIGTRPWRLSDYSRAKAAAERGLLQAEGKTRLIILRLGVVHGDGTGLDATPQGPVRIDEPGARLPLLHISNFCHAIALVLTSASARGAYLLVDDEQPNVMQYWSLKGASPEARSGWIRPLLAPYRWMRQAARGKITTPREFMFERDLASRRNVYCTYKIKEAVGYVPPVALADQMVKPLSIPTLTSVQPLPRMRVAMIGLGRWGASLATALKSSGRFELAAYCDPRPEALDRAMKLFGKAPTYSGIGPMLETDHFDGAVVSSPNFEHLQNVRELAPHVKRIYLEKPMANSAREREAMEACVQEHKVGLIVGHTLGYSRGVQMLSNKIEALGRPELLELERTLSVEYAAGDWRSDPARCPGGVLAQLGVHLFDVAVTLLGNCELLEARLERKSRNGQIMACSFLARSGPTEIKMRAAFGEDNMLRFLAVGKAGMAELLDHRLRWNVNGVQGEQSIDDDGGLSAALEHFYLSCFNLARGIEKKALAVAGLMERGLELLSAGKAGPGPASDAGDN